MVAVEAVLGVLFLLACGCVLWLIPAWLVARYAEAKGHSFAGFLVAGLLVSWALSLIVALVLQDHRTEYIAK